jgi:hypothetical protein
MPSSDFFCFSREIKAGKSIIKIQTIIFKENNTNKAAALCGFLGFPRKYWEIPRRF